MPKPSMRRKISALFREGDLAPTADATGDVLEQLVAYLFAAIKGVPRDLIRRNALNNAVSQEIDIALWNDQHPLGLPFLPSTLIAECKNWSVPIGAAEIDSFAAKLQDRMCEVGILIAASGVTGDPRDLSNAHERIATYLVRGIRIIVLTRKEIAGMVSSGAFIKLLKVKLTLLTASRTSIE
jgi:hypothetical protein